MKTLNTTCKTLLSALGFTVYFSGMLSATGATLDVSQKPLILNETVAPNLILTLDDSTSMNRAFVPDVAGTNAVQDRNDIRHTKRAKSAHFNPMYYDPKVIYLAPISFNSSGTAIPLGSTFNKAFMDGFKPAKNSGNDWLNLTSNYRPAWTYARSKNGHGDYTVSSDAVRNSTLAKHPDADFRRTESLTSNNSQKTYTTPGGVVFTFNRGSSAGVFSCSVKFPGLSAQNITCTRSSSDYTANLTEQGVPAYYYLYDQSLSNCGPEPANIENCYRLVIVSSASGSATQVDGSTLLDERENFAIWYSFYRTRALATLSAASIAFYNLPSSSRLTWQSLIQCTALNSSSADCGANQFKTYSADHKKSLFNWLQNETTFSVAGGTPLRSAAIRAGEFLKTSTAWDKEPGGAGNTADNTYACRPSYQIVMTDGSWSDQTITTPNRHDSAIFTLPDNKVYSGNIAPFSKTENDTLADIAMHYWASDLRPTLPNELRSYVPFKDSNTNTEYWDPRNNPATWQHMVNFTMGLGLTEALNFTGIPWEGGTFQGSGYSALKSGTAWPPMFPESSAQQNRVYDLWHAAINSRGEFFSVDGPDDMVKAFKDILNRIADRTTSAARPAVSASFVSDATDNSIQSNVYATQFSSEDWSGELTKTLINSKGVQTLQWSAKEENKNIVAADRTVMIKDSNNATSKLKNFTWNNLDTLQQGWLNLDPASLNNGTDSKGANRVAYIRGDRSQEGTESTTFRKRSTIIGDIINSSPVVVGTPAYLAYLADQIENPSGANPNYKTYGAFRTANVKANRKEMIYVGGNDGMLHGFNAKTGKEEFAFIPSEVIKNLYRLTGQNYQGGAHHFYVDGSPIVRDVYFGDAEDEGWRTVLIGTLRAGGKALFALDITDPGNIKLLWEFDSSNDSDLGYTFAQPEITRLHTGEWAVLMGNGYNSTNDRAALLIIDIKTGNLLKKLVVPDVVDAGVTLSNGLSSVRGADNNGDGVVDYAYAGDLQGNLWRFDLIKTDSTTSTTSDPFARSSVTTSNSDFKIAYGGNPLFTARDADAVTAKRQAITIQPSLVRHPSGYGYLVLFGTGKYFENSDANVDTSRAMTLYGVWDRKTKRQATTTSTARATDRTKLGGQQFTSQVDSAKIGDENQNAVNDIRLLSQNPIKWYNDGVTDLIADSSVYRWGWMLNLAVNNNLAGEMIVNNMAARGQTLFVTSLTPNEDPCKAGADTWLYGISAYTGGRTNYNVLDLNNDKIVNSKDTYNKADVVTGVRFPAIGGFTLAPGNKIYGSDGANDPGTVGDDPNTTGRQSWHIVPEEYQ